MSFFCGNSTLPGSTGNQAFTGFGFQPAFVIITIGKSGSGTDATLNYSEGTADGTRQSVRSMYSDTTGAKTDKSNTKCVSHMKRVSGTIVEQVAASLVSFDADGLTLNFTATDSNYQINVKAFA